MAERNIYSYSRISKLLRNPPGKRRTDQVALFEQWFRKKSQLFASCDKETLLDVIQHCDFVNRNKDDVIILQGEKGHSFFIILRGKVSVMLKDSMEDVELGDETLEARQMDRATLGNAVVQLGEGATFGELALIHADCVRTASIVADEKTDLVVIRRELYDRSVSKVIAREYEEKMSFIDSIPLIKNWSTRMKRQLAVSFRKETCNFDSPVVKQGDPVQDIHFIVKGEVKMMVDPEAHYNQYERFMTKNMRLMDAQSVDAGSQKTYFPLKLLPQLEKYTRMSKASQLNHNVNPQSDLPTSWSPSAIRKMNHQMHQKRVQINLCFLGERQTIGDAELLLGLDTHHASAICSRETQMMVLHKNHFDRLFRKKNPITLKEMNKSLETQLTLRCLKSNILETTPLLRMMLYKVQDMNGERRPGDEAGFVSSLRHLAQVEGEKQQNKGAQNNTPNNRKVSHVEGNKLKTPTAIPVIRQKTFIVPKVTV